MFESLEPVQGLEWLALFWPSTHPDIVMHRLVSVRPRLRAVLIILHTPPSQDYRLVCVNAANAFSPQAREGFLRVGDA